MFISSSDVFHVSSFNKPSLLFDHEYAMNNTEIIKKNINYLLSSRKETQVSLSDGAGVNRTTIYKILEGRVERVQENTLRKVAGFFGVTFKEIQSVDLQEKELSNRLVTIDGNMNPLAVPIIKDTTILSAVNAKIGRLVMSSPITYFFGEGPNVVGILLTKEIKGYYNKGDVIIVRRESIIHEANVLVVTPSKTLKVIEGSSPHLVAEDVVGTIIEERYGSEYKI